MPKVKLLNPNTIYNLRCHYRLELVRMNPEAQFPGNVPLV